MNKKINDRNDSLNDSDRLRNRLITEVIKDNSPFMWSNKLLIFSLFYKWMKLAFLVYLLEAKLFNPNGESSKYEIESNDLKISNEEHIANWKIKELDLEFTLILSEGEFEVKQTEVLQDKLKNLGFISIKVKILNKIID